MLTFYVVFLQIFRSNNNQLIFKKRLTKTRAQKKISMLQEEGWIKTKNLDQAA